MSGATFHDMISVLVDEIREFLDEFDSHLQVLTERPSDPEALKHIHLVFHTIKGSSAMLAMRGPEGDPEAAKQVRRLKALSALGRTIENRVIAAIDHDRPFTTEAAKCLIDIPALLRPLLDSGFAEGGEKIPTKIEQLHAIFETGTPSTPPRILTNDDMNALFEAGPHATLTPADDDVDDISEPVQVDEPGGSLDSSQSQSLEADEDALNWLDANTPSHEWSPEIGDKDLLHGLEQARPRRASKDSENPPDVPSDVETSQPIPRDADDSAGDLLSLDELDEDELFDIAPEAKDDEPAVPAVDESTATLPTPPAKSAVNREVTTGTDDEWSLDELMDLDTDNEVAETEEPTSTSVDPASADLSLDDLDGPEVDVANPVQPEESSSDVVSESDLLDEAEDELEQLIEPEVELDEMLGIFVEEVTELIGQMTEALGVLSDDPHDADALQTLRRGAHTVKGSGAMLGYDLFQQLGLAFEESAEAMSESPDRADSHIIASYQRAVDWLVSGITLIRRGTDPADVPPGPVSELEQLLDGDDDLPLPSDETGSDETSQDALSDDPMRTIYLKESTELIAQLSQELLNLEKEPDNAEVIHKVLRAAHTLKGSAATLGYTASRDVAHSMEDLLQMARDGEIVLDMQSIDVLLEATDCLDRLCKEVFRSGSEESDAGDLTVRLAASADRLKNGVPQKSDNDAGLGTVTGIEQASSDETEALREIFLEEARGLLDGLGRDLVSLELDPDDAETVNSAMRNAHTLKGSAAMLEFERTRSLAHAMEDTLQAVRDKGAMVTDETTDLMLDSLSMLEQLINGIAESAVEPDIGHVPDKVKELRMLAGTSEDDSEELSNVPSGVLADDVVVESPDNKAELSSSESAPDPEAPTEDVAPEEFDNWMHARRTELMRAMVIIDVDASDVDALKVIRTSAGTITRVASKLGHDTISRVAKGISTLVSRALKAGTGLSRNGVEVASEGVEALDAMFLSARANQYGVPEGVEVVVAKLENEQVLVSAVIPPAAPIQSTESELTPAEIRAKEEARRAAERRGRSRAVEVDLDRLNRLMNLAAELVISRTRLSSELERLDKIVGNLDDEGETLGVVQRRLSELKGVLEKAPAAENTEGSENGDDGENDAGSENGENVDSGGHGENEDDSGDHDQREDVLGSFTDAEFDRFTDVDVLNRDLRDSTSAIAELTSDFGGMASSFDQSISRISMIAKDLHDEILRVRMVRVERAFTRIPRILRDAARGENKKVNLNLEGSETEIDKNILEAMNDPLLHLIRNTVSHGVEDPEERARAGKPEIAQITVRATQEGNQVVLEVEDDGHGIDPDKLRRIAANKGLLTVEQAAGLNDAEVMELIFEPGFSSAEEVNELSGRGVGLDVVRNVTNRFNGSVSVDSAIGRGTTFRITLPLTLAIGQALLVQLGTRTFALPLSAVQQIEELPIDEIQFIKGKPYIYRDELPVPLIPLAETLGSTNGTGSSATSSQSIVLVREGERQTALAVNQILGREEIVIKTLGGHLRRVPGISGATILGDGSVVMILNVAYFLSPLATAQRHSAASTESRGQDQVDTPTIPSESAQEEDEGGTPAETVPNVGVTMPAAVPPSAQRSILVVDDSISIRKYVSGVLERSGYEVMTANDGVDAWEKLQNTMVSLVISDLEMPNMHGYELIAEIKKSERTRGLPVVFLTARAGEKHRRMGFELGAAAFLNKPFNEPELLKVVNELVAK
jgi:chemosensory pili system protein ChpA (sensor histidine kinase/response regulator)